MSEQVMPRVNGKRFYCTCGCGVFTVQDDTGWYVCNGCRATYEGEAAPNA